MFSSLLRPFQAIKPHQQQSSTVKWKKYVKSSFDGNSAVVQCNVPIFNLIKHKFDATCNFHQFRIKAGWNNCTVHQMQIWRTTRSAPGTSRMKATVVELWCLVLTMLPQKSLASSSIWSVLLCPPYTFLCSWMPSEESEIFHSRESVLQMEARSSRPPKEPFKFRLEDLRKCVSDHI